MYRLEVKRISRTGGRTVHAAAAYITGTRTDDVRRGRSHRYTRGDVERAALIGWQGTHSALWDAAEAAERRADATTAREYVAAIPREFSAPEAWALVEQFGRALRDRYGVAVSAAMHAPKGGSNRHAHLLTTSREVGDAGQVGPKTRALDDRATGPAEVERIRATWAALVNDAAQVAGIPLEVNHRSHARQGDGIEPTHVPAGDYYREQRGERTGAGDRARASAQRNAQRGAVTEAQERGRRERAGLDERRARRQERRAAGLPMENPRAGAPSSPQEARTRATPTGSPPPDREGGSEPITTPQGPPPPGPRVPAYIERARAAAAARRAAQEPATTPRPSRRR